MLKSFPATWSLTKAAEDGLAEGQFRAVVSVFGNKDSYGDVIVPGAFAETLAEWEASGDAIPIYWSHRMDDPDMNIGYVMSAAETEVGLEVVGQLDLSDDGASKAKTVHKLLKGRRTTQFSFAYDVLDGGAVEKDGDTYFELRKLKLYEVGPTPIGANQETELLAVKQAATAAQQLTEHTEGLSLKADTFVRSLLSTLEESSSRLKTLLAADEPESDSVTVETAPESSTTETEEPASEPVPFKSESAQTGAKAEEKASERTSVATWETAISLTEMEIS